MQYDLKVPTTISSPSAMAMHCRKQYWDLIEGGGEERKKNPWPTPPRNAGMWRTRNTYSYSHVIT
jgi:hypothetical protein